MSEKVLNRNKWREVGQVLVRGMSCVHHDPFQMSLGPSSTYFRIWGRGHSHPHHPLHPQHPGQVYKRVDEIWLNSDYTLLLGRWLCWESESGYFSSSFSNWQTNIANFADDTAILYTDIDPRRLRKRVNIDLKILLHWLKANKFHLNTAKTDVILFRQKQKVVKTITSK